MENPDEYLEKYANIVIFFEKSKEVIHEDFLETFLEESLDEVLVKSPIGILLEGSLKKFQEEFLNEF